MLHCSIRIERCIKFYRETTRFYTHFRKVWSGVESQETGSLTLRELALSDSPDTLAAMDNPGKVCRSSGQSRTRFPSFSLFRTLDDVEVP